MMNNAWKLGERPAYEGRAAWRGEDPPSGGNKGYGQSSGGGKSSV